jgi:hypothetical protein
VYQPDVIVWPNRSCSHVLLNEGGWVCSSQPTSEEVGGQAYARTQCCSLEAITPTTSYGSYYGDGDGSYYGDGDGDGSYYGDGDKDR